MVQSGAGNALSTDQVKLILDVSNALAVTADLDLLLTRIATAATSLLCAERASIFIHDAEAKQLWTRVVLGTTREIRVPDTAGIVGHVFQTNEVLEVPHPYEDPRFNREVDKKTGFVTRNLMTAPLRDLTSRPLGVLQIVNRIGGPFTPADRAMLSLLADQAGVAIQRHRFQQEVIRSAGLRHEMDLAHRVQTAMIPLRAPTIANIRAVGWTKPASVTGGDCFDFWEMTDGRLGLFLGDASGHGIAPAIIVSQARTLVRALAEINCDPRWLLTRVNSRLASDLDSGRFVTAFCGCLSSAGELQWSSAGHGPMLWRRDGDTKYELLEPTAPPLGVLADLPADIADPIEIHPGGTLVIMSDGIFEARNAREELFEVHRVLDVMEAHKRAAPEEVLAKLKEAVREWQGKEEPDDDQTVIIAEIDRQ